MRCAAVRCHYNDDGYCSQPDYAYIDKNGVCEQMYIPTKTITERYTELRQLAEEAYAIFDSDPTQANSDAYGIALNNLRDFCIGVLDIVTKEHPEITDKIYWEED